MVSSKKLPSLKELSIKLRLRGGEKKLAKKILLQFERKSFAEKPKAKTGVKQQTPKQKRDSFQTQFVGMISHVKKHYLFNPILQKNPTSFHIRLGELPLNSIGEDTVVAAKKIHSKKAVAAVDTVEIKSILGSIDDPRIDSKMLIWKSALPSKFPQACLDEAAQLPDVISPNEFKNRADLRHIPFVTIDGEDARDFDDAVAMDEHGNLWVAIADVAHFVPTDSALDKEASYRGNSYYFPDTVLPMLPEKISNFLCSLRPNEDKLCMAIKIKIHPDGTFVYDKPVNAIMKSRARLTYDQVDLLFNRQPVKLPPETASMLAKLREVTQKILKKRLNDGGIDFELSELKFLLNDDGTIKKIVRRSRTPSQSLIEELMLLANRCVAAYLSQAKVPCVYRVHENPSELAITEFVVQLENLNIKIPKSDPTDSRFLNHVLQSLGDDAKAKILRQLALRTMKQAFYSPQNSGHFGLGFTHYLHFTSPIRRYADLVVHRALKKQIDPSAEKKEIFPAKFQTLENVTLHISEQERVAQRAEFDIRDIKSIRFLSDKVGEVFHGHISSILPSGLFVTLIEYPIEGFIHVSKLDDDYYDYREDIKVMVGRKKKKSWKLADPITIRVEKVSLENMRIDFSVV